MPILSIIASDCDSNGASLRRVFHLLQSLVTTTLLMLLLTPENRLALVCALN